MWKPQVSIEYSPVALLSTLVTETSFLTKPGVYQSARWHAEQSPGVILLLAARGWDYRYMLLVFAIGRWDPNPCLHDEGFMTELPFQVLHTLKKQYEFTLCLLGRSIQNLLEVLRNMARKKKKSISLVKGLLSCSSRVPSGWKSPQSYLHISSLGGDLPSTTSPVHIPQCTLVIKHIPACVP